MSINLQSSYIAGNLAYITIFNRRTDHILIADIVCLEGLGNYTKVFLKNGKTILCSKTLKQFEEMITKDSFLRIHKSYLINLSHVNDYNSDEDRGIEMTNGIKMAVSRRKKKEVEHKINEHIAIKIS
jgi:two-component system LytT family response regulator